MLTGSEYKRVGRLTLNRRLIVKKSRPNGEERHFPRLVRSGEVVQVSIVKDRLVIHLKGEDPENAEVYLKGGDILCATLTTKISRQLGFDDRRRKPEGVVTIINDGGVTSVPNCELFFRSLQVNNRIPIRFFYGESEDAERVEFEVHRMN